VKLSAVRTNEGDCPKRSMRTDEQQCLSTKTVLTVSLTLTSVLGVDISRTIGLR